MKKHICILLSLFFSLAMNSQSIQEYYLRVKPNKTITPTSKTVNSNGTLDLIFSNSDLQSFFSGRKVYEFYRPFETSSSEHLRRIYKVVLEDNSNINNLLGYEDIESVTLRNEGIPLYQPNDYNIPSSSSKSYLDLVHVQEAWDLTHGDDNVLVGITDTYFPIHDDLVNKIVQEFDTSNSTYNHGVPVAGIIAANTNNGIGIASIGYNTKLVVSDKMSPEEMWNIAQLPNVKVLNGSWLNRCSFDEDDDEIFRQIWEDFGVVVVFAAGNGHCGNPNNYVYPASYPNTISVSSVGHLHNVGYNHPVWGSSNWKDVHQPIIGTEEDIHQHNDKVDLVAPGYNIKSLNSNNGYSSYWGTSSAAPMVSATCALMFAVNPDLTSDEVRDILKSTTDDIYNIPENQPYLGLLGTGRLNVYRAVKTAKCLFDNDSNAQLDLYMRNSKKDLAVEPDSETGNIIWSSKDIWVRNQADGKYIQEHQNPEYDPNNPNYVYVKVRNTSCVTSSGNDQLKLYWAKANTSLSWPNNWNGSLYAEDPVTNGHVLMGNEIATLNIPILKPGQETIIEYEWNVPNPEDYININRNPWHFSLLSRIVSNDDPMTFTETSNLYKNVKNNNNIAWRNTTIVDIIPNGTLSYGAMIAVANPFNESRTFKLEFIKGQNENGKAIYNEAEIGIKMDDILLNAWTRGGKNSANLEATNNEGKKIVKDDNVLINNIQFEPNELGTLYLTFNFLTKELTDKDFFTYHIIQRDAITNEIIGGETFEIRKKPKEIFIANAGNDKEIDKNEIVLLSANEILNAKEYNWYDEDGNLIYTGKDFTVSPDITKKYKLEVIDQDGFKDYDEIEVKVTPYSLDLINPNPASNQVDISFSIDGASSAYLMLVSTTNGTSNNYIIDVFNDNTTINISTYQNGIYSVILVCDGQIIDSKSLIKN